MKSKEKFLVIGANGLVGDSLCRELKKRYCVLTTSRQPSSPEVLELDLFSAENIREVVRRAAPTHVVQAANLAGGVRYCEKHSEEAKAFHFDATRALGEASLEVGAKLLFISTECVFDGKKETYDEEDAMNPLNQYGHWKAKSEEWISRHLTNYLIIRTMFVYGWQPSTTTPNAVMSTFFSLQKKQPVQIPVYRWGCPTYAPDLAEALQRLLLEARSGIFHVAGPDYVSRWDWLSRVAETLQWESSLFRRVEEEQESDVRYPHRIRFTSKKYGEFAQRSLPDLEDALTRMKEEVRRTHG